jgi:5-methylcytosine-specific restriction enzyme subunit McrC
LDPALARELMVTAQRFHEVTNIHLQRVAFRRVQLHRNNTQYDLLLRVAELAYDCLLPDPRGVGYRFHDVLRDERKMAIVFESFVRNFYRAEQRKYMVQPLLMQWDAEPLVEMGTGSLPSMRVDIFLNSPTRKLIIDTKYYADALQSYYGSTSFRSAHLYQIFAYLRSAEHAGLAGCDGLLLYPEAASRPDAAYTIHGHEVQIATVNLAAPWQAIAARLHALARDEHALER